MTDAAAHSDVTLRDVERKWLLGDWPALANIDPTLCEDRNDARTMALMIACALQNVGEHERARRMVRQALNWGCDAAEAARLLLANAHNTLGRIATFNQDESGGLQNFARAVDLGDARDRTVIGEARAIREIARLGLLPQATGFIERRIADGPANSAEQEAKINQIKSELQLLRHELALSIKKGQILTPTDHRLPLTDDQLSELQRMSPSQIGQDLWVLERTGYKRGGFFVEFGATDGVVLSNTYLLERQFGWTGLLAEPNPVFLSDLKRNRTAVVSDACIAGASGDTVEFVDADAFGGIAKHFHQDAHTDRREAYRSDASKVRQLVTISLHDFLEQHGAPPEIDYISVDTEGSEWEILSSFPFDRWRVGHWTIEHNLSSDRTKILKLMAGQGYQRVEARWEDWYYLP